VAKEESKPVSLRLDSTVVALLDRLARLKGTSRNALAERYLLEGSQMDDFPDIWFRDGALGRRPALRGTRLDVHVIVETIRNHDDSLEETAEYLDLPVARVRAAAQYYAANRDAVDEFAARANELADRAEEIARAEREVFSA